MTTVGRNDPCPCGSGKKYKRCCLPADSAAPRPGAGGAGAGAERPATALLAALGELVEVGWETLVTVEFHSSMALLRSMGFEVDELLAQHRIGAEAIFRYAILGAANLTPRMAAVRATIRPRLDARARALHDRLLRAPFGVWDLRQIPAPGVFLASDATALERDPVPVANAVAARERPLRFQGDLATGVVGWIVEHEGLAYLLVLGQLDADGEELLQQAIEGWPVEGRRESPAVARDILLALVDPRETYQRDSLHATGPYAAREREAARAYAKDAARHVANAIVGMLHDSGDDPIVMSGSRAQVTRVRWFRERIATAAGPRDMAGLVDFVRRFRDQEASRSLRWTNRGMKLDSAQCEELLPVSQVVGAFGLRPDGALANLDDDELLRRPAALLLLDDASPLWADVHPSAPIGLALDWAKGRPGTEAAVAIDAAWRRLREEERWLATFRPVEGNAHGAGLAPRYEALLHAFGTLFAPAVLETPLDGLGLGPRGAAKRVARALASIGKPAPDDGRYRLADLPATELPLTCAKNYGDTTHRRLVEALALLAGQWRARRAGIAPPSPARATDAPASQEVLKEGLDELAALFEATAVDPGVGPGRR